MVGDLRYSWKKLRKLSTDVSDNLARLQVLIRQDADNLLEHALTPCMLRENLCESDLRHHSV